MDRSSYEFGMVAGCLEPDDLMSWVGGRLSEPERASALAHIESCAACRQAVSALAQLESIVTVSGQARREPIAIGGKVGRFRITRMLGYGGMGVVLAAHDEQLDREVAIKMVRPELAIEHEPGQAPPLATRLVREARALAALRHPNLVTILEVGEHDGWPFLVMELVEGANLRRWLDRTPAPTWRDAVACCVAAGRGLAALHAAGYLHRDIKPDNVIVASDGRIVLVDLGLAKQIAGPGEPGESASLTRSGAIVGTPRYLAPERVAGEPGDVRSEVYAFCAMTLEVARARPAAALPSRLQAVLARGVDPDPAARFATIAELITAIERALARRLARPIGLALTGAVAVVAGGWWIAGASTGSELAPLSPRGGADAAIARVEVRADAAPAGADAAPVDAPPPTVIAKTPPRPGGLVPEPVVVKPGTWAKSFERTLSIAYLRDELHRRPATAAFAEAKVMQRSDHVCPGGSEFPFGWDWGVVERHGIVDVTDGAGKPSKFLLYQVRGQHRRYLFDAYTSEVYLDVPDGALVLLCPARDDHRRLVVPAGYRGDFVFMHAFGGPVAGAPSVLGRRPRPRYLKRVVMTDGAWSEGAEPVLFLVADPPRANDHGRRDMGIYFLDAAASHGAALDGASRTTPIWVVATFVELQLRDGTSYPALRVDDIRPTLFTAP